MRGISAMMMLLVAGAILWLLWDVSWRSLTSLPSKDDIKTASASVAEAVERQLPPDPEEAPPAPTDEAGSTAPTSTVRFVEQDGIVGIRVDGPLERAPSVARLSPPPPPPAEEPDIYRLVVIEAAGLIDARSHKISLAHVDAPDANLRCTRPDGVEWPCGRRARTAMRRLIRRRAIECLDVKPVDETAPTRPAVCTVAGTDLSRWLVAQGWAEPADTAPELWRQLHADAKSAGLGLYAREAR